MTPTLIFGVQAHLPTPAIPKSRENDGILRCQFALLVVSVRIITTQYSERRLVPIMLQYQVT